MTHTETQLAIWRKMEEICKGDEDAFKFYNGLCDSVLTWDHIIDDESVDPETAERAFQFLLLDAPLNPFFQRYKDSLVPVIMNAVSSWKFSNGQGAPKIKAYDIYTEVACAIAFILGGREAVEKHIPELRQMQWQNCQEDDATDGGKK
jgi:hypothetical protein